MLSRILHALGAEGTSLRRLLRCAEMIHKFTNKLLLTLSRDSTTLGDSQSDASSSTIDDSQLDHSVSAAGQEVVFAVETLSVLIKREMKLGHSHVETPSKRGHRSVTSPRKQDSSGKVRTLQKQFDSTRTKLKPLNS